MLKRFIIGIDLGGTNLKVALLDLHFKIRDKRILDTKSCGTKKLLISCLINATNKIIQDNRLAKVNILGLGIGLPGPIDIKRGLVHFFPNIRGWQEVNLKGILRKRLGLPIFLDNDANLMCLAEHRLGAAKGFKNVVCLTLGTGVGGGIIIEDKLYRGLSFAAGEIGHIPINEKGPRCNCRGQACLEAYIGNARIIEKAQKLFRRKIALKQLSVLAKKGNQKAIALWSSVAEHLGIALAGVVNFLNPDCIVIGGGISGAGRVLLDKVRKVISERAMIVQARHAKIFKARLGNDAGLIGAAILVKEGLR